MVKKKKPNKSPKAVAPVVESIVVDHEQSQATAESMTVDVCGDPPEGDTDGCLLVINEEICDVVSADAAEDLNSSLGERLLPVFKDPNFVHSSKTGQANAKKTRSWKNVKQIIAAERTMAWGPDDVTYGSIDAPPSFKPAKKYSDVSGLTAKYTDPQTKLRYTTSDEFSHIRLLPADLVAGYLALRKANLPVP